jgi:hypothetical protein
VHLSKIEVTWRFVHEMTYTVQPPQLSFSDQEMKYNTVATLQNINCSLVTVVDEMVASPPAGRSSCSPILTTLQLHVLFSKSCTAKISTYR